VIVGDSVAGVAEMTESDTIPNPGKVGVAAINNPYLSGVVFCMHESSLCNILIWVQQSLGIKQMLDLPHEIDRGR
jgi:hypothetical protein